MNGWSFARPEALWLLLAIPLLWWLARSSEPSPPRWTGALSFWRRSLEPERAIGAQRQRGLSRSIAAALIAVALTSFALADLRRSPAAAAPLHWQLVLDRSASMFLPASDGPQNTPRIRRAVEQSLELCERSGVEPQAREWLTFAFDGEHSSRGARPPEAWLDRAWGPGGETPWLSLDRPDCVWISDCEPGFAASKAGLVQSGATTVPGPVADLGSSCLVWDGKQLAEQPWASPRAGIALDSRLPRDITDLAILWAQARELTLVEAEKPACLLIARADPLAGGKESEGKVIGPGWSAPARLIPAGPAAGFEAWAEFRDQQGSGSPAVLWRPGAIQVALSELDSGPSDPAAFAVAWSELFDRACLSDPSLVSLSERRSSGPPALRAPTGVTGPGRQGPIRSATPWLALLASLSVLASLALAKHAGP